MPRAGSGLVGMLAFLWLFVEVGRRVREALLRGGEHVVLLGAFGTVYCAVFLVHGLVDYFLKFTPTFLLFWLVLGMLCIRPAEVGKN